MDAATRPETSAADTRAIAAEPFLFGFPDASFTAVVSPNADTLYSTAFIDVEHEPVVLR